MGIKYASLFSGIGGFEKGIEQASEIVGVNAECVFASEIDKFAQQTYTKHFGSEYLHGDITNIDGESVPDIDLLVGGFPCQAFSIAGKRKGFDDCRGTLFFDIARIMRAKKPKVVLLENVKGLLNHDKGNTFRTILSTLDELGYDAEWQVLNSKNHGVPQNRERVFIVGHLRGHCRGQVFPIRESRNIHSLKTKEVCDNSRTLMGNYSHNWGGSYIRCPDIAGCLTAGGHSGGMHSDMTLISHSLYPRSSTTGKGGTGSLMKNDGSSYCLDTGNNQAIETVALRHLQRNGRLSHTDGYMGSLQTSGAEEGICIGKNIRRLTPIECERLQGFPDNWTEGVSNTQRYKQLGNSVTVNVIEAIMIKILSIYGE